MRGNPAHGAARGRPMARPLIGITTDIHDGRFAVKPGYARWVARLGGDPVLIPPIADVARSLAGRMDALILTGGDDPDTTAFGEPPHPAAELLHPDRQAAEMAILRFVEERPNLPVLGICLGMQLMGLHAGGVLDQHLPDHLPSAADHWGDRLHPVEGAVGRGEVCSHHHQALRDPGRLQVMATSPDGVIEAVADARRPFYLGVQWHPERTPDSELGRGLFAGLLAAIGSES